MSIKIFHRYKNKIEVEKVFAHDFLTWLYCTQWGLFFRPFFTSKLFSRLYGRKKRAAGRSEIFDFVEKTGIDLSEFENGEDFQSYHEFFIRKFKPDARNLDSSIHFFPAFCEARYLIKDQFHPENTVKIKNHTLKLSELIGQGFIKKDGSQYSVVIARLAPQDYHRIHFPWNGKFIKRYQIAGRLDTVTDYGANYNSSLLMQNERVVNIFELEKIGRCYFVEVGAITVGKIKQTFNGEAFSTLEEKGYFEIGGSTVVLIMPAGQIQWDQDIIKNSEQGLETFIKVGDQIGRL